MPRLQRHGAIVSKPELAEILGLSTTRLSALINEGMPHVTRGSRDGARWQFDTAEVIEWLLARQRDRHTPRATKAQTLSDEKRRHTAAAADLKEIELAQKRATIISRDDADRVLNEQRAHVARRVERIARVARECANKPAPVVEAIVRREVIAALTDLSTTGDG